MDETKPSRYSRSPIGELGGLVKSIRSDEAIMLHVGDDGILIASQRLSSDRCRIRIVAAKHILIRMLKSDEVATLIKARKPRE